MKHYNLTLLLGITLLMFSCQREDSDTVDQDKIYTQYILEYNSNQDVTYARAHFQFSNATGTKLELVEPAQVEADGEVMPFKQAFAYYEKDFVGVKSAIDFSYTDTDENNFNNSVEMVSSIDFPNGIDTLSRSSSFELFWDGPAVAAGEVVTVTIDGSGENDAIVFTQAGIGATSVILTQDKLSSLGLEDATFHIRRVKNKAASDVTSASGRNIARYLGAQTTIYIEE